MSWGFDNRPTLYEYNINIQTYTRGESHGHEMSRKLLDEYMNIRQTSKEQASIR